MQRWLYFTYICSSFVDIYLEISSLSYFLFYEISKERHLRKKEKKNGYTLFVFDDKTLKENRNEFDFLGGYYTPLASFMVEFFLTLILHKRRMQKCV